MKVCTKCGTNIDEQVNSCPSCGTKTNNEATLQPNKENTTKKIEDNKQSSVVSEKSTKKQPTPTRQKETGNKRPLPTKILSVILIVFGLVMLYYFVIKPSYYTEAEVSELTLEQASGYWISNENNEEYKETEEFNANHLTLSLYLDDEYVIITKDGGEIIEAYSLIDYQDNEDKISVELKVEDTEKNEKVFFLTSFDTNKDTMHIELGDKEIVELISVSEEDYKKAGGLNLRKEAEIILNNTSGEDIVEEVDDKTEEPVEDIVQDELSLNEVTGYYVGKDENGVIDFVYYIQEDYTSQVSIHPLDRRAAAYSASIIEYHIIEDNVMTLEVLTSDHNLIRDKDYVEQMLTWQFDTDTQPLSFQLNNSESLLVSMELEEILDEFNGELSIELEDMLNSLIDDVIEIVEDFEDGGNFSVIESNETVPDEEVNQSDLDAEYSPEEIIETQEDLGEDEDVGNFSVN